MPEKIEISHRTIIFTILFLVSLWFLYQIRQVLLVLFMGIIVMSALNPLVSKLERIKIPRLISILIIYILIFGIFGVILAGIIPPLISQTTVFFSSLTKNLNSLRPLGIDGELLATQLNNLVSDFGAFSAGVIKAAANIFGNLFGFFAVLIIGFYLLLERKRLEQNLAKVFGARAERVQHIIDRIESRLGRWVIAQISLMIIVAVMTYLGLRILKIDFALPLAILAGLLEVIPNFGPVISAIPGVIAGLAVSPLLGLGTAAMYFIVQQLENQLIVPQVMSKEVGINPLITILALIAGFSLSGVGGAFLALPVVIVVEIFFREFFFSKLA
jgi:predicted PurR-regulated permease PerM